MPANLSILKDLREDLNKTLEVALMGHVFKFKFLTEKEEQIIMGIIGKTDLEGYAFVSELNMLQMAFALQSIDGNAVYVEDINGEDSELSISDEIESSRKDVVTEFSSWDSDIWGLFVTSFEAAKESAKRSAARDAGIAEKDLDSFVANSVSSIESLVGKFLSKAVDLQVEASKSSEFPEDVEGSADSPEDVEGITESD